MKCRSLILILLILFIPVSNVSAWYDSNYGFRARYSISSPGVISLNLSNSSGNNNATWLYGAGHFGQSNFSDIRFVLNDTSILNHYIQINNTLNGLVWVNTSNATAGSTIYIYFGNSTASDISNGTNTFPVFDHFTSLNNWTQQFGAWTVSGSNLISAPDSGATSYLKHNTSMYTSVNKPYQVIMNISKTSNAAGSRLFLTETNTPMIETASTGMVASTNANLIYAVDDWTTFGQAAATIDLNTYYLMKLKVETNSNVVSLYNTNMSFIASALQSLNSAGTGGYFGFSRANGDETYAIDYMFALGYPDVHFSSGSALEASTIPSLLTPANNSVEYHGYPPLTEETNFTWIRGELGGNTFNLQVAEDINFNLIAFDGVVSTTHQNVSLTGNQTYYWRVRNYDNINGTAGAWSFVFNFLRVENTTAAGIGIQGITYELLSGVETPVSGAIVYIYNSTWSNTMITGSNGYYLFSGLSNSSYNIYATRQDYETTPVLPVNISGGITTNNILMKRYISPYVPNFVYEKFIVRDLFDRSYVGVTVVVYEGDGLTPYLTGTTDSAGQAVFRLNKDQRYRVTFTGGGISGTITIYVYAKEESYFVRVLTGFPTGGDRYADINTSMTAVSINATHSYLQLVYNDTKGSTSMVNFYATNLTTNTTCYNSSASNVVTLTCTVLASGTYQFGFNATSSIYGFFQEDKVINFGAGTPNAPLVATNVDKTLLQWASIILIVLTAALFSIRTVKYGAVIVPLEALALWVFGWFEPMVNNQVGSFLVLSCAVVLGVMIYLRASEVKVNF